MIKTLSARHTLSPQGRGGRGELSSVRPFLIQGIGSLVNVETLAVRTLVDEMLGFGKGSREGTMRIIMLCESEVVMVVGVCKG